MHPHIMGDFALTVLKQLMREQPAITKDQILHAVAHQQKYTLAEAGEFCSRLGLDLLAESGDVDLVLEPVVHGLMHGFPLCAFTRELPKDWPQGHVWVRYDDPENMNCQICIREALRVRATERG